ncbi:hypothetical protein GGF49_000810 [Coemansia sp. RSA 1853]|nr:hypothetical protein GGF49_000810 [Coemansia sp. RSA 1853]
MNKLTVAIAAIAASTASAYPIYGYYPGSTQSTYHNSGAYDNGLLNDELPALPHGLAAAFWWALNPLFQLLVFDPKGLTLAADPLSNAPELTFVEDDTGATGTIGAAVATAKKAMVAAEMVYMAMAQLKQLSSELQNGQTSRGGSGGWHSAKGGEVAIDCPGQEILERTSAVISDRMVEARLTAGLPAAGRTILASAAQRMFLETLPQVVERALMYRSVDPQAMHALAASVEDQEYLRSQLESLGLVAFIGNGAVLPRVSGVSNMPLATNTVVRFQAPPELQVMVELPNQGAVVGMGIRQGVTLICGGGFNGKSTLLQAIERGVYNHAPGDGRERVVTDATATKIKAEEGRFVCSTDIRPFINNLPLSKTTDAFSTANASGSTSMAASIQEAVEVEASTLLFDEDTCATNFLVRDGRMQQLVSQDCEPITPLVSRVRELWEAKGVSSIMVIGGCGDYLDVADTVVSMHGYVPSDVTKKAKDIARRMPVVIEIPQIKYGSLAPPATSGVGADAHERTDEPEVFPELDLTALDQLVSVSQTRAIASMLQLATQNARRRTMRSLVSDMCTTALGDLPAGHGVAGNLARPRGIEVALAINRLRYAQIQP